MKTIDLNEDCTKSPFRRSPFGRRRKLLRRQSTLDSTHTDGSTVYQNNNSGSFRSSLKEHSQRCSQSILKGAVDLRRKNNAIEAPKEQSWTTDVDGRPVTFALMNNVTKPPKISRSQRMPIRKANLNVHRSSRKRRVELRIQRWLTQRDIPTLTTMHLAAFLLMNIFFAGLWWMEEGGCCSEEMTFAQTFNFAVQTSSTIGYGKYHPEGYFNNALVVLLMSISMCLNTVYAGLLFFKFITPNANIEFSEVITMSNVMGHACLEIRVGNADGDSNKLINAEANLCITSIQEYKSPHEHDIRHTSQTEELKLAVSHKHKLDGVWTLRHFIDENSPLYGMRFDEFPGNTIQKIELNVKAVHANTKGEVNSQAVYQAQDILVGWHFENQYSWDPESQIESYDYSKLSSVRPSMVWYPKGIADIHEA